MKKLGIKKSFILLTNGKFSLKFTSLLITRDLTQYSHVLQLLLYNQWETISFTHFKSKFYSCFLSQLKWLILYNRNVKYHFNCKKIIILKNFNFFVLKPCVFYIGFYFVFHFNTVRCVYTYKQKGEMKRF